MGRGRERSAGEQPAAVMCRADEYEVGQQLHERSFCAGRIVSMRNHPRRNLTYMLLESDNMEYTVYACLPDAKSKPWLARFVPASVMYDFLFDAFLGFRLPSTREKAEPERVPVTAMRVSPSDITKAHAHRAMPRRAVPNSTVAPVSAPVAQATPAAPKPLAAMVPGFDFP